MERGLTLIVLLLFVVGGIGLVNFMAIVFRDTTPCTPCPVSQLAKSKTVTTSGIAVDDLVVAQFGFTGFSFIPCNCTLLQIKAGQFTNSSTATVCFSADHQIGIKFEFEPDYCYSSIEFAFSTNPSLITSYYNAAPGQFPYKYTCLESQCCPAAGQSLDPVYFQGTLPANVGTQQLWIAIHENVKQQVTNTTNTAFTRGNECHEFSTVLKPNGHPYTNRWGAACPIFQGCPEQPLCVYHNPIRTESSCVKIINGECVGQHVITCDETLSTNCTQCNEPEYLDLPCDECPEECVEACSSTPAPSCAPWAAWTPCGVASSSDHACTGTRTRDRSCTNCPSCVTHEESSCQCPPCNYSNGTMGVCSADVNPQNIACECFGELAKYCLPTSVPNCACNLGSSTIETKPCTCSAACSSYKTFTQGGWGAAPNGNNPGVYLANNFAAATAPDGFLVVGKLTHKYLKFTSAKAVEAFLPSGGSPAILTASATYSDGTGTTPSGSNAFAGQLLAAKLNLAMDAKVPSFNGNCTEGLAANLINNVTGCYSGYAIAAIVEQSDLIISEMMTSANPCDSPASLTAILDAFNKNSDNGITVVPSKFVECV